MNRSAGYVPGSELVFVTAALIVISSFAAGIKGDIWTLSTVNGIVCGSSLPVKANTENPGTATV